MEISQSYKYCVQTIIFASGVIKLSFGWYSDPSLFPLLVGIR